MLSILPDAVVTTTNEPVTINVLANDTGDTLTITSFSNPANGSLVFNADRTFTYTPTEDFIGDDGFSYTVRDAQGTPASIEVTISVLPNADATVATDDIVEVVAVGDVIIPVLANDMVAGDEILRISAISVPSHGAANVLPDQTIRYVPQDGFVGIDSFNYTITDENGESATATVTIKVVANNIAPLAVADTFTIEIGTATILALLANDSDPDGGTLQIVGFTMPSRGSLAFNPDKTFTYTPDAGYLGTDRFSYTIRDSRGASASASVDLNIVEIGESAVALDDHFTTASGTPVTIDVLANDTLPAEQSITIVAVSLPFKGRLTFNPDKTITYTPNAGFVGTDDFTYTIGNGKGDNAKATVTVEVMTVPTIDTYANGYSHRRRIVIPASAANDDTHMDFPLWVEFAVSWLRSTTAGGEVTSLEGHDIRFELVDGTKLAHEIDHYDATVGKLGAWVRLPELKADAATTLLLYYGKPGLAESEAAPQAVWQDYLAVWHLPETDAGDAAGRALTELGAVAAASEGLGAGAISLSGDGVLSIEDTSWLDDLSALSVQLRSKASGTGHDRGQLNVGSFGSDAASDIALRYQTVGFAGTQPTNVIHSKLKTTAGNVGASTKAGTQSTAWQSFAFAWQSGDSGLGLYLDGQLAPLSYTNQISGPATTQISGPLYLGAGPQDSAAGGWVGLIDEVRFSARKLGEAWIATEYANQTSPAGFYGYGDGESVTDTEPSVVALPFEVTTLAGQHADIDVLAAAVTPELDDTVIQSVTQTAHGSVSIIGGKIRYTPVAGYVGPDSFTYTLASNGKTSTSNVAITVRSTVSNPQGSDTKGRLLSPVRTVNVSNNSQLTAALNDAQPGDHIVLANGTYSGSRTVSPNGTQANPIVIRAANPHLAEITGVWTVTGNHITIYQCAFTGSGKILGSGCQFFRLLRNTKTGNGGRWSFTGNCSDTEIAFNEFDGITSDRLIDFRQTGGITLRPWVHRNYFINTNTDNNIAFGTSSSTSLIQCGAIAEYNLFRNCEGTGVYFKVSGCIARFNTRSGTSSGSAYCVNIRHGKNHQIIANAAIDNSRGIAARGDNHLIIGNYYDNSSGHSTYNSHFAATGDCTEDQFVAGTGNRPRASSCQFIGNIGNLWIGGDNSTNTLPALDTLIKDHSGGTITIDTGALANGGGPRSVGTIDQRNQTAIEVPQYVILTAADVGPDAD